MGGAATRWLRRCGGSPAPALRLICLPYAGAGASMFNTWQLPDRLAAEVWAVQPPGRENRWREPSVRRVEPMVHAIATALRPLLDVPFALFGHSMGALLAFEVCRFLRRGGAPQPVRLFVSAHRSPDLPAWRPPVSPLAEPQFMARLAEMTGPSRSVVLDPELLSVFAPMMRADFELCETYRYTVDDPLDMPFSCFAAVDDPEVRVDEVLAWQRHTSRESRVHCLAGGHLFLRDHADTVRALIAADLTADVSLPQNGQLG
jgi:medium-chain acyl-[acyl-carrier-protein] hydrolase